MIKIPLALLFLTQSLNKFLQMHIFNRIKFPPYNVLHNKYETNSAYIFLEPEFEPGKTDIDELLQYVEDGNTVFLLHF